MTKEYALSVDRTLDCAGLACPMPIVKTQKTIETMEEGHVLEVQATDKGSIADLQAWARSAGHHYLGTKPEGQLLRHFVRKGSASEAKAQPRHPLTVTNEELLETLSTSEAFMVLDVREPAEYAFGHIPGAVSIPLGELANASNTLSLSSPIYIICRTGARSDLACQLLTEQGFGEVYNVLPGMIGWQGQTVNIV
ncbi:sulfurtransferase TusA family protein [Paenibacillus sp. strain BS8-2]